MLAAEKEQDRAEVWTWGMRSAPARVAPAPLLTQSHARPPCWPHSPRLCSACRSPSAIPKNPGLTHHPSCPGHGGPKQIPRSWQGAGAFSLLCPPPRGLHKRTINRAENRTAGGSFPFPADSRPSSHHLHLLAQQRRSHLIYPGHEGDQATGKLPIRGNSAARMQELGRTTATNTLQENLKNPNHCCKTHQTTSSPSTDPCRRVSLRPRPDTPAACHFCLSS